MGFKAIAGECLEQPTSSLRVFVCEPTMRPEVAQKLSADKCRVILAVTL